MDRPRAAAADGRRRRRRRGDVTARVREGRDDPNDTSLWIDRWVVAIPTLRLAPSVQNVSMVVRACEADPRKSGLAHCEWRHTDVCASGGRIVGEPARSDGFVDEYEHGGSCERVGFGGPIIDRMGPHMPPIEVPAS